MKIKNSIKGIVLIAFLLVINISYAQHNHGGSGGNGHSDGQTSHFHPPHNGEVKEAGKYKVELVKNLFLKNNQLELYIYKGEFKPIATSLVTGTITITYADGSTTTNKLVARGNEQFVAQVTKKGSFTAKVSFNIKKKNYFVMFSHKSKVYSHSTATHTCPMHPEIVGGAGETCPKCGMSLQKKK
jgi:hypothetical protein